ncbi:MAG: hypothetical protein JJE35_10810 [Thermoleophilia bacterium]|nr:hypothetical protein [Thermoleophilia bacterium]
MFLRSQRALAAQLLKADSLQQAAAGFLPPVAELLRSEAGALWAVGKVDPELNFVEGWSELLDAGRFGEGAAS